MVRARFAPKALVELRSCMSARGYGGAGFLRQTGLTLLGVGWNLTLVAGSTWLTAGVDQAHRPMREGLGEVGMGTAAMDMTVGYLRQRKQFGRLIGEFQSLQHRAAHLYSELEIARAATLKAQQLIDEAADDAEAMVSVAKAKAGRASQLAVQEGVQMHGGIGMTDEYDIGLYMKRDRVLNELFGDPAFHADRLARMKGY